MRNTPKSVGILNDNLEVINNDHTGKEVDDLMVDPVKTRLRTEFQHRRGIF